LERLLARSSAAEQRRILKWKNMYGRSVRGTPGRAATAKCFDDLANRYLSDHPGCTVINLGCGLDTRFWRINHDQCRYMDLDLPEVIALKRELLPNQLPMNSSAAQCWIRLDRYSHGQWQPPLPAPGRGPGLLLARPAVIGLLQRHRRPV
jgi:hypothetical protein